MRVSTAKAIYNDSSSVILSSLQDKWTQIDGPKLHIHNMQIHLFFAILVNELNGTFPHNLLTSKLL